MSQKVTLKLRPYTTLVILKFCREFINDENKDDNRFAAIHESVKELEVEVFKMITPDMLEDAKLECRISDISGRHPPKEDQ